MLLPETSTFVHSVAQFEPRATSAGPGGTPQAQRESPNCALRAPGRRPQSKPAWGLASSAGSSGCMRKRFFHSLPQINDFLAPNSARFENARNSEKAPFRNRLWTVAFRGSQVYVTGQPETKVKIPIYFLCAALFLFAPGGMAQQAPVARVAAAPSIPSYPDSPKGLEKLMKDMLELTKRGDIKAGCRREAISRPGMLRRRF